MRRKSSVPYDLTRANDKIRSPTLIYQKASEAALRSTTLEWTRFSVGFFMDYYGIPAIKTHLPPMSFAVDMNSKKAAIPGTGNEPIALTYSYDVAKFVSAYLGAPKWEEIAYVYGEKTTWNAFIKVAEEVTGTMRHISKCLRLRRVCSLTSFVQVPSSKCRTIQLRS